ncbi:MAG TPA: MFS transporter [Candidatus Methanomethylophilaceae archaeon]|nr:MFS transporter [Candidatus Methanomethylophilaceae archaeon]
MKEPKLKYAWIMFAIFLTAYFFVYFHRMSLNVVGPYITEVVGGNYIYLSSIYFWTYAAMQIPCGMLADRFGPRKVAFVFLSMAALGSAVTAFSETFMAAAIGKMMIAAGMAAVYIPMMKVIATWFPPNYFPQLVGIVIAVGNIGAISATVPLQISVDFLGWRGTFVLLAVITLVIAVLCFILIRDLPPGASVKENTGMVEGLKTVFSSGRKFWPMALAYFLIYGTIMVFQGTVSKSYFNDTYTFVSLTIWIVAMIGIGKILSTVLVGVLSGRGFIKSKRTAMIFGNIGFALVWLVLWVFAGSMDSAIFWGVVCTLFGFFGGFMSLSFTQVKEWHPTSISGTAVAALNVFLFLGSAISLEISGFMLGETPSLENYSAVWGLMFAFSMIAILAVFISKENIKTSQRQL